MDVKLHLSSKILHKKIAITGSKSETNRLLLLNALYPAITILNASESDDSAVMRAALSSPDGVINVHHAGTAMRFLTAYFALQEGREVVLTGSQRMKERPIKILVNALRSLGADIEYLENEGFPPLKIWGKKLMGGKVAVKANVSSQYLSALLLIGSKLTHGLELELEGEITSLPYLKMTIALLQHAGIKAVINKKTITVDFNLNAIEPVTLTVESDWSSASYYYSIVALADEGTEITLTSYKQDSLQGDSALAGIYKRLGVSTHFNGDAIILKKINAELSSVSLGLNNTPDIAQTIAVTCLGLGLGCTLTGLHTLKIKETDRLEALKNELERLGAKVEVTNDTITLLPSRNLLKNVHVQTYNDHRMAMAFAPIALKVPIIIKDAGVVSKSYPEFWSDLQLLGFTLSKETA